MRDGLLELCAKLQTLGEENGQDLIEYALLMVLIALAATAGMQSVAGDVNNAFLNVGSKLIQYTT